MKIMLASVFESTAKFDSSLTMKNSETVYIAFESTAKFDSSLTKTPHGT